ncbi:HAD family hydrolase [Marinomonas ushuaiensis DSM 15871]|uniref:HAD family hydrolase n=1 Tax=Marinomonas ushuaiensis DSM 15871 TaxID=1122207 RepID=X7E0D7_9GAMM|nr:HAD-IA family hydrolase [Marinomonas ushuaiensis]ETX09529.1 HAD family hydrolase [Marinomonas ushuaiensis DSM 15871]
MSVLVTFDLDNTLWDVTPVIVRAEYAMESWFEERFPGFAQHYSVSAQDELKRIVLARLPDIAFNLTALRLEVYKLALKKFGLPSEEGDLIAESALAHFCEWRQKVDLFPHVVDVLEELSQDYSLAVITNGNADVFHPYVGLGQYFDFAIRADQLGVAKPDAGVFSAAAKTAKMDVSQIIHIGDHPVDDVFGASNVGAKSIWFNRHGARRWDDEWGTCSSAEVHSLLELPTAIRSLML